MDGDGSECFTNSHGGSAETGGREKNGGVVAEPEPFQRQAQKALVEDVVAILVVKQGQGVFS